MTTTWNYTERTVVLITARETEGIPCTITSGSACLSACITKYTFIGSPVPRSFPSGGCILSLCGLDRFSKTCFSAKFRNTDGRVWAGIPLRIRWRTLNTAVMTCKFSSRCDDGGGVGGDNNKGKQYCHPTNLSASISSLSFSIFSRSRFFT